MNTEENDQDLMAHFLILEALNLDTLGALEEDSCMKQWTSKAICHKQN